MFALLENNFVIQYILLKGDEKNAKPKKVGEVFSDYKTNSNIKHAEIEALNVVKKQIHCK